MKIRFWGVRGSVPSPLSSVQLRSKISSIVARLGRDDLIDEDSRERFLSALPQQLFSTVGGNTACVELSADGSEDIVILDAGTGIRELGHALARQKRSGLTIHVFFSHFHWDHIQGLPFFGPLFDPSNTVHFYSLVPDFEAVLKAQMRPPYFPVEFDVFRAKTAFHVMDGTPLGLDGLSLRTRSMNHPSGCAAYHFQADGRRFIYSTDTELVEADFLKTHANMDFFGGADAMVIDAQYTLGEAIEKYNWGHSAFSVAIDFASSFGIGTIFLFHHEPSYDDRKLGKLLDSAEWYAAHLEGPPVRVLMATEGMEAQI